MKTIKFIAESVSKAQINWGNNVDPKNILYPGMSYEVDRIEIHSQSTGVFLKAFPGKKFNGVWFDID